MSITVESYYKQDYEDDFEFPNEIAAGALEEYSNCPEINNSFKSYWSYYTNLVNSVCQSEREEFYLRDTETNQIIGCVILQAFSDIHYDVYASASVLWVNPAYRDSIVVCKAISSIFRKFCTQYGIRYYKRVSKVTPYIYKHIVREVKQHGRSH